MRLLSTGTDYETIQTDYRLVYLIHLSTGARDFLLHSVHTDTGAHPASYSMDKKCCYPCLKRPGHEASPLPPPHIFRLSDNFANDAGRVGTCAPLVRPHCSDAPHRLNLRALSFSAVRDRNRNTEASSVHTHVGSSKRHYVADPRIEFSILPPEGIRVFRMALTQTATVSPNSIDRLGSVVEA
jgi:hypothetical protein